MIAGSSYNGVGSVHLYHSDYDSSVNAVSYTHLTLPTILLV